MEVHGVLVQSEKQSGYRERSFARILVTNWYGWIAPALEDMQPSVSDAKRYFSIASFASYTLWCSASKGRSALYVWTFVFAFSNISE